MVLVFQRKTIYLKLNMCVDAHANRFVLYVSYICTPSLPNYTMYMYLDTAYIEVYLE